MARTIIWASDGSDNAAGALPHALDLLDDEESLLIAVHVAQERTAYAEGPTKVDCDQAGVIDEVRGLIGAATERGTRAALRVVSFPGTQPAQGIADIAEEGVADIIVVGTRGHSPVAGVLLGSVAQRLLEVAACAVLAVPPGAAAPARDAGSATKTAAGSVGLTAALQA